MARIVADRLPPLPAMRLALLACLLVSLALPAGAQAHAAFVGSVPAAGARVETAPQRIVINFTEPLNEQLSRAKLLGPDGREVPATTESVDGRLVITPADELPRGAYVVSWHTVSTEDAHALEGSYSFGVRAAAASAGHALEESPLARGGWARVAARLAMYVALLLFGGALFLQVLVREQWRPGLTRDIGLVAAACAAVAVVLEAADAAGGLSPAGLRDFLLANLPGLARVALVLLTAAAALVQPRLGALLVLLALGALATSGHAGSAEPRVPSIINDWVHLTAGALWLGGLGMVVVFARDRREALRRFTPVALPAFATVIITGGIGLILQLDGLSDLVQTAYGRILSLKIALVAAIAGLAWAHQGRRWKLIRVEPFVGLGVMVAVALLVTFPLPPRQLSGAADALASAPPTLPPVADDEISVADAAGTNVVAAWIRRDGTGEVRVLDRKGRPGVRPRVDNARDLGDCGKGCLRFSDLRDGELRVGVGADAASLPATWQDGGADQLRAAQRQMRKLRGLRSVEVVRSGPGAEATTRYALQAPDRMLWETTRGVRSIVIGKEQWIRTPDTGWTKGAYGGGGLGFNFNTFFRWTPYAPMVRRLGTRELALADPSTPVWHRLTLDRRNRVVRERLITRARFVDERFFDFGARLEIDAP
jgi:methionine-rich copper-binding protein CopC/putative copper export protein